MPKPYIISMFDLKAAFSLLNNTLPEEMTIDLGGKKWKFRELSQSFLSRCEYVKRVEPLAPKVLFVYNNLKQTELFWNQQGFSGKQNTDDFISVNNFRLNKNSLTFKIASVLLENPNFSFEDLLSYDESLKLSSKKSSSNTAYTVWRMFQIFLYLINTKQKRTNG